MNREDLFLFRLAKEDIYIFHSAREKNHPVELNGYTEGRKLKYCYLFQYIIHIAVSTLFSNFTNDHELQEVVQMISS